MCVFNFFAKLILLLFTLFASYAQAVDVSILQGEWKNKNLSLFISESAIKICLIHKSCFSDVKYEFIQPDITPYPFISIAFSEDEVEHLLYLAVGKADKDKTAKLVGFYEKSTIVENTHGELISSTGLIILKKQLVNRSFSY